eukprot:TRINITY_DN42947_c0_g1_i1.p1 TRINITY_DN42947_c0_g1~~TRINITY_DN42947_c0_g1_i1.p1  ORF type:complete len:397 (-),score=22.92 TRINITY_DN42947_c0_g1_i1:70-1182(-)
METSLSDTKSSILQLKAEVEASRAFVLEDLRAVHGPLVEFLGHHFGYFAQAQRKGKGPRAVTRQSSLAMAADCRDGEALVDDSFSCAICLEILCEPLLLPCSHAFCRSCLICHTARGNHCPLCRQQVPDTFNAKTAEIHTELEEQAKRLWPAEYARRLEERSARVLYLRIGNRFKVLCTKPCAAYRWTVFVELEASLSHAHEICGKSIGDLVDRITFASVPNHRVFRIGSREVSDQEALGSQFHVNSAPFQLTATGWHTTASVIITIVWQAWLNQQPTHIEHTPEFTGDEMTDKGWLYAVHLEHTVSTETVAEAEMSQPVFADGRQERPGRQPQQLRRLSVIPKRRFSVRGILPGRVSRILPGRVSRMFL